MFKNPFSLEILYYSHVRSHVEYCPVVWHLKYDIYVHKIESIKQRFLKFVFYRFEWYTLSKFASYEFKRKLVITWNNCKIDDTIQALYFIHDNLLRIKLLELINFINNVKHFCKKRTFMLSNLMAARKIIPPSSQHNL